MAFFQLLMKANKIEKARIVYHDEKLHAIEMSKGIKPHYTLSQKIRMKKIMLKIKVMELIRRLTCWHEDSWCYRTISLLKTDGTFENFLMKSIIGFMSGVLLTYMLFLFMIFHLDFTLFTATMFSSLFGIILTIGLAFSYRIRCVVLLLLPQFFSKRGRQALIAYAFILTLTGPTKNTLNNVQVLSESLTCGQEELKKTITSTIELIKEPFHALHDTIAKLLKRMQEIVKKVEKTLLAIKRVVINILRVIKSAFEWLGSIVSICNKKVGTPYERCSKVFEGAVADCHARLGPFFGGICSLTYIVSVMCYLVKPLDFICILISFTSDIIVDTIRKKIKKFSSHMKVMFYVKVNFTHSFHFETNKSKSYENVAIEIMNEMKARAERFQTIFNWMNLITSFFILCMLLRVLRYHHKWLTSDRYDNKYLTNYFRHIDLMRTKKDKETVLPLNKREKRKYIPLTSITMIAVERNKLLRSALFLSLTTFNICIHITVDYSLFWILDMIRYHGRFQTKVQQSNSVGLYISGTGYLAELYRSIIRTFSPENFNSKMDTLPCLPDPLPPDYDRYTKIAVLIISCWIMTIFEPYGLRLRQVVMGRYYPDRAKQRAVYLYNEIIRSRGNFLKFARRQLRRKYGMNGDKNIDQVTLKERLLAICPKLNICFPQKNKMCLLCGDVEREGRTQHVKCPDPNCIGLFCMECFADLQNICTICKTPMEYGDLSDISEEKDSSDDDIPKTSARERGGKCELVDEKLQSMETRLTNRKSKKNRDDVTIQIFNESLRGGADVSSQNFTFNNYEMSECSSPSISLSSVNQTVSCSTKKTVETEMTYTEIDEDRNKTNHNHPKKKNWRERFGQRQSPGYKGSKIYKHKFTSKEQFINASTPADFSSNQKVGNTSTSDSNFEMNTYYYQNIDDTDSTNDDHERSQNTRRKCFAVRTRYMHESNKCYAINERNPMQSETSLNVRENAETGTISRRNLETFNIDSDSQTSSGELFSLNETSESTPELSKLSDLSIGIDTESSSEAQRRREIIRWYQKKSDKK